MFFKKKSKSKKNRFYKTAPSGYRLKRWDYLLLSLTLLVGLFIASVAQRWGAEPVAQSSSQPALPEILRVQILNACGTNSVAEKVSNKIKTHNPTDFYYFDLVDKANFRTFDIQESFVAYAQEEHQAAAAELCRLLGLPGSRIIQEDFQDNFLELNLKVILGQDHQLFLGKE